MKGLFIRSVLSVFGFIIAMPLFSASPDGGECTLLIESDVKQPSCFAQADGSIDITVYGGTEPYSYSWSHGPTTEDLTGLGQGEFILVVTDAGECSGSDTFDMEYPDPIYLNPTIVDNECHNGNEGSISLNVTGGTQPYSYNWTMPNDPTFNEFTSSISGLRPETYWLHFRDANGCYPNPDQDTIFTLVNPAKINITGTLSKYGNYNLMCNGDDNGSIDVSVTGTQGGFNKTWTGTPYMPNDANFTGPEKDLVNVPAGQYTYLVIDSKGCTASKTFVLSDPEPVSIYAEVSDYSGFEISCNGEADGSITAIPVGGHEETDFDFVWTYDGGPDPPNDSVITGLEEGNYSLLVTDAFGCQGNNQFTLESPPVITLGDINGSHTAIVKERRSYYVQKYTHIHYQWQVEQGFPVGVTTDNSITVEWPTIPGNGRLILSQNHVNECYSKIDTFEVTVQEYTSSIEDHKRPDPPLQLSPNPALDRLQVRILVHTLPGEPWSILDLTGREVMNGRFNESAHLDLNVSHLPSGIYFFRAFLEPQSSITRFMVRH